MTKTKKKKTALKKHKSRKVKRVKAGRNVKFAKKSTKKKIKKEIMKKTLIPEETDEPALEKALEEIEDDNEEGKPDEYEEKACEFMNEAECKEEMDDEGLDYGEEEEKHFGDKEE